MPQFRARPKGTWCCFAPYVLFISYAHEDDPFQRELEAPLKLLMRGGISLDEVKWMEF